MKKLSIVWGLVGVFVFSGLAWSQSLADVARKEEERRKSVKTPGKVYTNDDLRRYPVSTVPDAAAATGEAKPAAEGDPAAAKAKDDAPSVDQGEEHWRKLASDARAARARSSTYMEALERQISDLNLEFYNSQDPGRKSAIITQRARLVEDAERLKQDMADQDKAVAKIEEDAQKANVPPGWIR
jgi:hypothetical protein